MAATPVRDHGNEDNNDDEQDRRAGTAVERKSTPWQAAYPENRRPSSQAG
jgi:hypothetical protein